MEGMIHLLLDHLCQTSLEIQQATVDRLIKSLFGDCRAMDKGNYGQRRGPLPNALSMESNLFTKM